MFSKIIIMDGFPDSYDLMGLTTKNTGGKISKVRFDNTKREFESSEVLFATGSWDSPKVYFFLKYTDMPLIRHKMFLFMYFNVFYRKIYCCYGMLNKVHLV